MGAEQRHVIYFSREPDDALRGYFDERGWRVDLAESVRDVRRVVQHGVATAGLLDFSPGFKPAELRELEACLSIQHIGWIAATRRGQLQDATLRHLIRDYCFDYVTMPYETARIVETVGHAHGMIALADAAATAAAPVGAGRSEGEMVGTCDAMLGLFRTIRRVATTDAPVFISGESGTGKELTAAAIHERSTRAPGPFVAINCGAIPSTLLQAELFGYERGAFTGATQRKVGRVEAANGGTLFLDEIGDLPFESQASLLRFLQEGKIERLGAHVSVPVDVRVICATHVDMEAALREGRFREDLYHRLCVLKIEEPPLRARGKDIELLARHMLERFKGDAHRRLRGFSPDAIAALYGYAWPGNVRELINRVRRAIVMSEGRMITAADLELNEFAVLAPVSLNEAREAAERQAIEQALLRHRGRFADAARELGVSRVTLYRLMCAHGMRDRGDPLGGFTPPLPEVSRHAC
ncbi:TPA: sigma-54-dependent Fis family transcriptional regulator [Burkholderia vietnamiensis]|uniref:sigma-54 dependent transcriptional regulator n=1 Tax=Burkholderia vietnamiensis TaxID=60552 RepID=UPI0007559EC4|nr:sigma-54 dependent transcriptional regulator [Burkholderia vietnamiensis]KVS14867.1 Fis family transcriptional regulator [Burkholderia vietnamiensis]MCA8207242.1 sigma-54 dependent transcriptional regulator [Burkholderia vietnamiensis]HDR9097113.1 sigma-54-dependent Fis family transcriptional regulator [Burkholderia vietnamiensis]HDR9119504.1 sigma-54-dependent Fis family transcriptional regulator [Burkholderia vietnamiensis]HDR9168115.1 sigma-54-dependent Fis family transcriptional regulat